MTESTTPPTTRPEESLDDADHGAETGRRYNYQYAWGVVLLCGLASGKLKYTALWCEHHEDFLARRDDGKYDAIQIKSRQTTLGAWKSGDPGLRTALTRFTELYGKFGHTIATYVFVSNMDLFNTSDQKKVRQSLLCLKKAVDDAGLHERLTGDFAAVLETLAGELGVDREHLFAVLHLFEFQKGPSLEDFEDVVPHTHVASLNGLANAPRQELNELRDALMNLVRKASSRTTEDPAKHWYCLNATDRTDPLLAEKEITIEDFKAVVADRRSPSFSYVMTAPDVGLGRGARSLSRFEKKVLRGGLGRELDSFRRRTLSAENHLLEVQYSQAEQFERMLNDLVSVVKGDCDDASTETQRDDVLYGKEMMRVVQERLRERAHNKCRSVYDQEYECLVGIAGLLTDECKVWWSTEFDVEGEA